MTSYFKRYSEDQSTTLELAMLGDWTVMTLAAIQHEFQQLTVGMHKKIILDAAKISDFDTSAAWFLKDLLERSRKNNVTVDIQNFHDRYLKLYKRILSLASDDQMVPAKSYPVSEVFIGVGRQAIEMRHDLTEGTRFLGKIIMGIPFGFFHPRRLRIQSIIFHVNEVGIKAIPIIGLMAFSIAFVMGYQGAFQLQKFDATIYTVDLVVLSVLREMGVLITAIMLAGRSGSAFAAQIGTMKLNEEVDALQTMGVSPFEILALPRIIAIMIALPFLTVIANMMGLLGGYIFSSSYLGFSYVQFLSRAQEAADMQQFWVGVSKAPVFALLIGIVGCMQGLQAKMSAEDVGRRTVTAVVQAIFLVIVVDAVFSVVFTKLGI